MALPEVVEAFTGHCEGFAFLSSWISQNLLKQHFCVFVKQSLAFACFFLISSLKHKRGDDTFTKPSIFEIPIQLLNLSEIS